MEFLFENFVERFWFSILLSVHPRYPLYLVSWKDPTRLTTLISKLLWKIICKKRETFFDVCNIGHSLFMQIILLCFYLIFNLKSKICLSWLLGNPTCEYVRGQDQGWTIPALLYCNTILEGRYCIGIAVFEKLRNTEYWAIMTNAR